MGGGAGDRGGGGAAVSPRESASPPVAVGEAKVQATPPSPHLHTTRSDGQRSTSDGHKGTIRAALGTHSVHSSQYIVFVSVVVTPRLDICVISPVAYSVTEICSIQYQAFVGRGSFLLGKARHSQHGVHRTRHGTARDRHGTEQPQHVFEMV